MAAGERWLGGILRGEGGGLQLPMLWSEHKGSLLALVDLVAKVREEEVAREFPPG